MKEEIKIHIHKEYYKNGQLHYEIPYKNGNWHGLKKSWYHNGQLWYETPYKNDIQCGAKIDFEY